MASHQNYLHILSALVLFFTCCPVVFSKMLLVGGNFTLDGQQANMAMFDIDSNSWSTSYTPHLYLYGAANGVVLDMIVDETPSYDNLYVVGAFDTTCKVSQIQYCNVGLWRKNTFLQVGDNLCSNSGAPPSMSTPTQVITAAVGDGDDLFIGGAFQFRVWTGTKFESVYNVAQFVSAKQAWLPLSLEGGGLTCNWCTTSVMTMAWDPTRHNLYVGGKFNSINFVPTTPGLAIYSNQTGLVGFPGGGFSMDNLTTNGVITALAFDSSYSSIFVAGVFTHIGQSSCTSIGRWHIDSQVWTCLHEAKYSFDLITSLLFMNGYLYVAGMPSLSSLWKNTGLPHTIARVNETAIEVAVPSEPIKASKSTNSDDSDPSQRKLLNKRNKKRMELIEQSLQKIGLTLQDTMPMEKDSYLRGGWAPKPRRYRGLGQKSKGSADDLSNNATSFQPKPNVTVKYSHTWEWLPYFSGTNDVITRLSPGFGNWSNGLFVAGVFTNMDPIFMWDLGQPASRHSLFVPPRLRPLGRPKEISGAVLSIVSMKVRYNEVQMPPSNSIIENYVSWTIAVICVASGILLGVGIALMCSKHAALHFFEATDTGRKSVRLEDASRLSPILSSASQSVIRPVKSGIFDTDIKARGQENSWADILKNQLGKFEKNRLNVINPKKIVLYSIIGQGSFGRVWSGVWGNSAVAVKEFEMAQDAIVEGSIMKDDLIAEIIGEAAVMSVLRHPKIVRLYGCSLTSKAVWIVSELCEGGNLRQLLDSRKKLSTRRRLRLALDICEGMLYLHTQDPPIYHRDLKSHNVFVREVMAQNNGRGKHDYEVKIGDLGSARARNRNDLSRTMTWRVGTACWLAPEVIDKAHYSEKSDVYAFGILLWEIATRQQLYEGMTEQQILYLVSSEGLRPPSVKGCPWDQIMQLCWRYEPEHRPTFRHLMGWFQELVEKAYNQSPRADRKSRHSSKSNSASPLADRKSFLKIQSKDLSPTLIDDNTILSPIPKKSLPPTLLTHKKILSPVPKRSLSPIPNDSLLIRSGSSIFTQQEKAEMHRSPAPEDERHSF